ncbi:hypothetical protein, partial [Gemmiger formicilis]|uniref:hypothetical protein n=1 Tax=Gemmiger formicilis TaxID=745368 RepID=UPI00195AB37F
MESSRRRPFSGNADKPATPPPLRGTSPYTGEAQGERQADKEGDVMDRKHNPANTARARELRRDMTK